MAIREEIILDPTPFEEGLEEVRQGLERLRRTSSDTSRAVERESKRSASAFARAYITAGERVRSVFLRVRTTIATALAALAGGALVRGLIQVNAELEQTEIALRTLTGSADAARRMMQELLQLSATTPFEFPTLLEASRQLMAFGFSAAEVLPMLRQIGDAVAALGGGAETFDRIIRALGQMRAKGRVSAEEMLQLTEAGLNAWQMLADAIGVSTAEVQELTSKGLIPADRAVRALVDAMGRQFAGAMQQQSRSMQGLLSTLRDQIRLVMAEMGRGLFEELRNDLAALVDRMQQLQQRGTLAEWGRRIGAVLRQVYLTGRNLLRLFIEYGPTLARLGIALVSYRLALVGVRVATALASAATTAWRTAVLVTSAATALLTGNVTRAAAAFRLLRASLMASGIGIVVTAIGSLAAELLLFRRRTDEASASIQEQIEMLEALAEQAEIAGEALDELTKKQLTQQALTLAQNVLPPLPEGLVEPPATIEEAIKRLRQQRDLIQGILQRAIPAPPGFDFEKGRQQLRDIEQALESIQRVAELLERIKQETDGGNDGGNDLIRSLERMAARGVADMPIRWAETLRASTEEFQAQIRAIQNEFRAGLIDEATMKSQVDRATAVFLERLQRIYRQLRAMGALTPEVQQAFEQAFEAAARAASDAEKDVQNLTETLNRSAHALDAIADAGRGLMRLLDMFGDLSDEVRRFVGGLIDAADALATLQRTRALIASGELTGMAATAALASSGFGVAAGLIGAISGLVGLFRRQERNVEAQIRAMEELELAVRDSAREFRQAVREMFRQPQVGAGLTLQQLEAARALVRQLGEAFEIREVRAWGTTVRQFRLRITEAQARELIRQLAASGIEAFRDLEERFDALVAALEPQYGRESAIARAIAELLQPREAGQQGLEAILDALTRQLGGFSDTLEGAIARLRLLTEFGLAGAQEAFDQFVSDLLSLELGDALREQLEQLQGLDITTEEGRARLQEIIAAIAAMVGPGSLLFEQLTPEQIEDLLRSLQQFVEGGSVVIGEGRAASAAVSRVITEVQANRLLAYQDELVWLARRQLGALQSQVAWLERLYDVTLGRHLQAGGTLNVRVEVQGPPKLSAADIRQIMVAIERELRKP